MQIAIKKEQVKKPIFTRNRKVAANVQNMYEHWEKTQFPSRGQKQEADPQSITSRKRSAAAMNIRLTRHQIRAQARKKRLITQKFTGNQKKKESTKFVLYLLNLILLIRSKKCSCTTVLENSLSLL